MLRRMKVEPEVDRRALIDVIRERYGLEIAALSFVPQGLGSYSYVAGDTGGHRVFLKLFATDRPEWAARRPGFELPLAEALAGLGLVRVPRPLRDREGDLVNHVDGFDLVLLELLEGRSLADERGWPQPLYDALADTLAGIHASTERVAHLVPRTERFELPFLPALVDAVKRLAPAARMSQAHPTLVHLADLLVPRESELRTRIARLEALRHRAKARGGGTVLCHTDFWGSNLILDPLERLHVLDWDGALLAPPEHDLFMFAGTEFFPEERFGSFLERYETAFRPVDLDAQVLGFYAYRRNLEDLADFVATLVAGAGEEIELNYALGYTEALIAEWPRLEPRITAVEGVVAARRVSSSGS